MLNKVSFYFKNLSDTKKYQQTLQATIAQGEKVVSHKNMSYEICEISGSNSTTTFSVSSKFPRFNLLLNIVGSVLLF